MTAIFVTATGTDIGKTFVTAGLVRRLRAKGQSVKALKPVVSGFYPAEAEGSDPGLLLAAMGKQTTPEAIECVAPWRYEAPLSPNMAARMENRAVDFDALVKFSRNAIEANKGTLLIEGVGGLMVPLNDSRTVLDWMVALKIPLLLVTGSYLGAISHTLTCLDVIQRRGLTIKALIVNETLGSVVPLDETVRTMSRFADKLPVATLERQSPDEPDGTRFDAIAKLL